jgi:hypothetical protein
MVECLVCCQTQLQQFKSKNIYVDKDREARQNPDITDLELLELFLEVIVY